MILFYTVYAAFLKVQNKDKQDMEDPRLILGFVLRTDWSHILLFGVSTLFFLFLLLSLTESDSSSHLHHYPLLSSASEMPHLGCCNVPHVLPAPSPQKNPQ